MIDLDYSIRGFYSIMEGLKFQKEYTRDTTIIIQESWGKASNEYVQKQFGWLNPYKPVGVQYLHQGTIEIWENIAGIKWLKDKILSTYDDDPAFFSRIFKQWTEEVNIIKKYWALPYLKDVKTLEEFIGKVDKATTGYLIYFLSTLIDQVSPEIKDQVLRYRETETFFASNSTLIRNTLIHLYPKYDGVETGILTSEISNPPPLTVLEGRQRNFLLVDGIPEGHKTLENYLKSISGTILSEKFEKIESLKGNIAFKGKVTGTVKILLRRAQVNDVEEGDIIVSPMTTPDFLPAMKKASAFITDEGGITCHAAIVARELKKPCIIGTKFATQVLKDGDMVEVDGHSGIVKIL
jgi:phosphohistidine swiveling domain-containing protein